MKTTFLSCEFQPPGQLQTKVQPVGLSGEVQCNGRAGEPPVNGQGVLLSTACDADWGGGRNCMSSYMPLSIQS